MKRMTIFRIALLAIAVIGFGALYVSEKFSSGKRQSLTSDDILNILHVKAAKYKVVLADYPWATYQISLQKYSSEFDSPSGGVFLRGYCKPNGDNVRDLIIKLPYVSNNNLVIDFNGKISTKVELPEELLSGLAASAAFPEKVVFDKSRELVLGYFCACNEQSGLIAGDGDALLRKFERDRQNAIESNLKYYFLLVKMRIDYCESEEEAKAIRDHRRKEREEKYQKKRSLSEKEGNDEK